MVQTQEKLIAFLNSTYFLKKFILLYKNFTFNGDHDVMYEIGKLVAVTFNKQCYPRAVVDTSDNKIEIRCTGILVKNKFMWPEKDNICWYNNGDIICIIESPTPVSQRAFRLCREDFEKVKGLILSIFWRYMLILMLIFCSNVFKHIRLMLIVDNLIF